MNTTTGVDPASIHHNETCAFGHVNPASSNMRCARCQAGFAPSSDSLRQCLSCGSEGRGVGIFLLLVFVLVVMFVILVWVRFGRGRGSSKAIDSTLKRTLLSHVQMLSIVMSLNVQWPHAARMILVGVSSVITLSGYSDSIHCSAGVDASALTFFMACYCYWCCSLS